MKSPLFSISGHSPKKVTVAALLLLLLMPLRLLGIPAFEDTPLKEVIQRIQEETPYYFLYRESQVAGIRITLDSSEEDFFKDLKEILSGYAIDLDINHERNQILLTRSREESPATRQITIKGQVVDAATGERLPYASLTWKEDDEVTGLSTNASGHFEIRRRFNRAAIMFSVSYIGYTTRKLQVDLTESNRIEDLTIRLEPETLKGNEITVSGFSGQNPSDSLLSGMIDAARFSPLGESNSIRALQAHPSVTNGTALNEGINIRGSTPDGFQVLLDGMSIFNQSHLFGLLDSFNADAIQSSGYYFGITPANIDNPTGGTLDLITRTGSRNEFRNSAGASNTAVKGTFEGPLGDRSSWLLSARTSYMDQINWFNNQELIQWGLDVDRPRKVAADEPDFTDLVLRPGTSSAQFIDVHGKIYHETSGNGRLMLSGYLGGDRTSHRAERRTRSGRTGRQFVFEDVRTSNVWGNAVMSAKYEQAFGDQWYSSTTAGFSAYETDFEKDDFVYKRIAEEENERITIFTYPFRNRSAMNEFKVNQELEYYHSSITATMGATWRYYQGEYRESSFDRPSFYSRTNVTLADTYLQTEWNPLSFFDLHAGGRIYYYSQGSSFLASPRLQLRLFPVSAITISAGYSLNHQFLHRISLENATTADVWILSTEEQPPASASQYNLGVEYAPLSVFYLKLEAYLKSYDQLRMHELNTRTLENTFSGTPWFYQNSGEARGVETVLRNRWNYFTLTQSYTLSRMKFQNPFLLDGEEFYADWDRTHSYNAVLETRAGPNLRWYLSWVMMSGASNSQATFGSDPQQRLEAYYRLDTTLTYQWHFTGSSRLDMSFSVFNLLNRDNVWYRNYAFNFDETRSIPRLQPVPVDVLDLGFQPSFSIEYSF